ncbi:MAG: OmpA family protein [Muribaculaceae bacterium]|nr:OmpA family protein [Muribaculaceae bacterium]
MKKSILLGALVLGAMTANAQAVEQPGFFQNWSMGLDGGVTTPMTHHAFFGSMRGLVGLNVKKQITPTFGLGVEGQFGVNTSSWKGRTHSNTAFDNSYVGTFGTVDLFNLFGGYNGTVRPFTIEALAGAGWGHYYQTGGVKDVNFFATKVGLNFNFNVSEDVTIAIKPSIVWDMTPGTAEQTSVNYNVNKAAFNLQAGVTYHFGGNNFNIVTPYNQAQVDALNGQINDLRAALETSMANSAAWEANAADLANQLAACMNRAPQIVKEETVTVNNYLNSVRYVFYKIGSSVIAPDQMPNVEMIAAYLKNHPESKVVVKGYASQDGPLELNIKLAQARAESVKNALVNKYKIKADRIQAEGEGIGNMFKEESWNRVSICTISDNGK